MQRDNRSLGGFHFNTNMSSNHSNTYQTSGGPANSDPNLWTGHPPPAHSGYGSYGYGSRLNFQPPRFEPYETADMSHGFGFDSSVSTPPFTCPPSRFPPILNAFHTDNSNVDPRTQVGSLYAWETQHNMGSSKIDKSDHLSGADCSSALHSGQYGFQTVNDHHSGLSQYDEYQHFPEFSCGSLHKSSFPLPDKDGKLCVGQGPDDVSVQKREDEQWVDWFLQNGRRASKHLQVKEPHFGISVAVQDTLYGAVQLVSKLSLACDTLKHNLENESLWADSYRNASNIRRELEEKLKVLNTCECLDVLKYKLSCKANRRGRRKKRKLVQMEEEEVVARKLAEKSDAIDKWRMRQIQEVEERKKEQELKLAADSVLSEVLKKQADVKRMQDILRSLEKLRKLRKEAASRKGVFPDQEWDKVFEGQLDQLRGLIKTRTAVYSSEEKALRVMLEGEQEEERRRDLENRQNKERERQLQRKQHMETLLFGDVTAADPLLHTFKEYYTQAEHSLPALVHVRRQWDVFLVPADSSNGTPVPQGWVLPVEPSDQAWASALDRDD